MQHLNIPLSRNSKTTRRTRWVVWILVFGVLSSIVASAWISALLLTRDTIYEAAPENTVMAARFFISGEKGALVESFLHNIPLVSNRALTFFDIAPYASGEFVLFVNNNGSRSIAIRTGKTPLPQSLLDAHSIAVQPIGHHIVLLSEHQETRKPFALKAKIFPGISFPGHLWIGELVDTSQVYRSFMHASKDRVSVSVMGTHPTGKVIKQIPEGVIAYLSNPLLPNTSTDFLNPFLPLLQSVIDPQFLAYLASLSTKSNQVILTKDTKGVGFFLTALSEENKKPLNIEQALRSVSALNAPQIQETLLNDGSTIKEIVANPDAISVEQITLLGTQMNRIHLNGTDLLAGQTENDGIFMTNREDLLRTQKQQDKSSNKICSGNMAGIALKPLVDMQNRHANSPNTSPVFLFAQNFTSIGVKTHWFSTTIQLCK